MKTLDIFNVEFDGFNLVEASAGTGKTYNITSLYIRAIIEKNLTPSEILVLTFTEDATAELKQRIRSRIQECISAIENNDVKEDLFLKEVRKRHSKQALLRLQSALYTFDEAMISTIHGFCQKLLREHSLELGVQSDFEILTDVTDYLQNSVDSIWRKFIKDNSNSEDGRSLISYYKTEKINPDSLAELVRKVLNKPYAELKPDVYDVDFNNVIEPIKLSFKKVQHRWEADKMALRDIIFSGKLNGNKYRKKSFENYLIELEDWINQSSIPLKGTEKLSYFGSTVITDSVNKIHQNEFPPSENLPPICEFIDEYVVNSEKMELVRTKFLKDVIKESREIIIEQKEKDNALSFDDLLERVDKNLTPELERKIAKKYPVSLVDEFQDTDPIQYSIFKNIFKGSDSTLFMIGDPKQAIYSFRGADLFTYFEATNDVQKNKRYSLDHNYRSTQGMISAVNQIFSKTENPFVFKEPAFRPAKYPLNKEAKHLTYSDEAWAPFSFIDCEYEGTKDEAVNKICEYVSLQINELLKKDFKIGERSVQPKDISILVRKSREAVAIQEELNKSGLKSSLKTRESIYKSLEAEDLRLIFKAISDVGNPGLVRAALSTSLINYSANDLIELQSNEDKWIEILRTFQQSNELYQKKGLISAFKNLDSFFEIKETLSKKENPERRLTNLDHILDLLVKRDESGNTSLNSVVRYLKERYNNDINPSDEELIRLESDSDLITVSTLHASKGLEYPIVFIPFLWDSFKNSYSKGISFIEYHNEKNELLIDLSKTPNEDIKKINLNELLADSLRLNYVAFTRAKYACFVPWLKYSGLSASPLLATVAGPDIVVDSKIKSDSKVEGFRENLKQFGSSSVIKHFTSTEILEYTFNDPVKAEVEKDESNEELKISIISRNDLFEFKRILSFSSISSGNEQDEQKDYGEFEIPVLEDEFNDTEILEKSKLSFPKGTDTGNLLHYIFEDIKFHEYSNIESVVTEKMNSLGFDNSWLQILIDWSKDILEHTLINDFKLKKLKTGELLKEMEFHFPVKNISYSDLLSLIRKRDNTVAQNEHSLSGFMKGFIDLIFRYRGKYYILDYKSNYLGNKRQDYEPLHLDHAIKSHNYDLQYYIYTVALVRFLKSRVRDFNYGSHFGGVIYLFLRGVDIELQSSGVYFDKPDEDIVKKIESLIRGSI